MDHAPNEHDGRIALREHVLDRARRARERHGPVIDALSIIEILEDREIVRYPVGLRFDASGLQKGEFAHAEPLGEHPREGFCVWVHPAFEGRDDALPLIVAYHIPTVNYGDIVESADCEAFGATLLALDVEVYYQRLCALADSIA